MNNEFAVVLSFFWVVSAAYTMYTHNKCYTLSFEIIFGAIFLGPILALFVRDCEEKIKKQHNIQENDRHRRWFQTMRLINRNSIPNWGRTIPPPPPISRIERAQSERNEAIRRATERIGQTNKITKDFKFFQK